MRSTYVVIGALAGCLAGHFAFAQVTNGGNQVPNGGAQMPNGGNQMPNGGNQMPNGGNQMPNGGNQMPNGGNQMPNGGNQMPNGGNQMPNGGNQMPNGGPQMGNGQMNGPGGPNGNMNGPGGPGGAPMVQVSAADCAKVATKLKRQGQICVGVANYNKRVTCFSQAPQKAGVKPEVMNSCGMQGYLDPLKNQLIAEEHAKYPNQPDALQPNGNGGPNDGNNGPGNGPNGGNGSNNGPNGGNGSSVTPWPVAQCQALIPKLTTDANHCLTMADYTKRSACFNSVNTQFPPGFFNGGCDLSAVKSSVQAQEKAKYPKQPSALH